MPLPWYHKVGPSDLPPALDRREAARSLVGRREVPPVPVCLPHPVPERQSAPPPLRERQPRHHSLIADTPRWRDCFLTVLALVHLWHFGCLSCPREGRVCEDFYESRFKLGGVCPTHTSLGDSWRQGATAGGGCAALLAPFPQSPVVRLPSSLSSHPLPG